MKTLEKAEMLERNKVMRVLTEERILDALDHPFLASLVAIIQVLQPALSSSGVKPDWPPFPKHIYLAVM